MTDDVSTAAFLSLVSGRRGHFLLESGLHGGLWLDLDALFADARRIAPFVGALSAALGKHRPEVICGPLLGGAFLAQLVAIESGLEFAYTEPRAAPTAGALFAARYALPKAYQSRLSGKRVAIVDDVMSAGSSLRATHAALVEAGAQVVAAGALLLLGRVGAAHFAARGVPVEAVAKDAYETWEPASCPQCAAGVAVETV